MLVQEAYGIMEELLTTILCRRIYRSEERRSMICVVLMTTLTTILKKQKLNQAGLTEAAVAYFALLKLKKLSLPHEF